MSTLEHFGIEISHCPIETTTKCLHSSRFTALIIATTSHYFDIDRILIMSASLAPECNEVKESALPITCLV